MSTLPKQPTEAPAALVSERAHEALRRSKGDRAAALRQFRRWIDNDDRLRRALTDPLIDSAIEAALSAVLRGERGDVWRSGLSPRPDRAASDRGLALLARSNLSGLLAFSLPETYKPLGEATKAEVIAAASYYHGMRAGFQKRELWLSLVAQAMKDEAATVRGQLREEDLQNLQECARREVEKGL